MRKIFITKSPSETKKIGNNLAKQLLVLIKKTERNGAIVLGLAGDLGSGKTTFLQGFAKGLGITEKVLSPTFIIMRRFKAILSRNPVFFYHLDCYRLKGARDAFILGVKDIVDNPDNMIAIEWAEKIRRVLPRDTIKLNFSFVGQNTRKIILNIPYTIRIQPIDKGL